ncbi:ArsR/SmtB family transcription factor [Paenibacillus lautus]|uniref:ArsR/SmtB family transcription factor n=1 Tax=Paenibacillus lautus TaxID=1401 RepID=UPI003D28132A
MAFFVALYSTNWLTLWDSSIIVNHMVEQNNEEQLDHIFHALADPTRREMVRMIAAQERTVSELAEPFDMSLAAASKHIKVLERSGLLDRSIQGRTHSCRLNPGVMSRAMEWLQFYERFWTRQFDALERELNKAKKEEH